MWFVRTRILLLREGYFARRTKINLDICRYVSNTPLNYDKASFKKYIARESNGVIHTFSEWNDCLNFIRGKKDVAFKRCNSEYEQSLYFLSSSDILAADYKLLNVTPEEFRRKYLLMGDYKHHTNCKVYCDGSVLSNGSNTGKAGIGIFFDNVHFARSQVSKPIINGKKSNGLVELEAVNHGLQIIWNHLMNDSVKANFELYSDSLFVVNMLNTHYMTYTDRNYRKLKHEKLVRQIIKSYLNIKCYYDINKEHFDNHGKFKVSWVKGHSTCRGNIIADKLARAGAELC